MSTLACHKNYSIVIAGCDNTIDWVNNPGNCRLRVKNYNPADWNAAGCGACPNGGAPTWDGTFPNYVPGPITTFQIPFTTGNIGGKAPLFGTNCAVGYFPGFGWYMALACNPRYIWSSVFIPLLANGPVATYFLDVGPSPCDIAIPSVTIESYSL